MIFARGSTVQKDESSTRTLWKVRISSLSSRRKSRSLSAIWPLIQEMTPQIGHFIHGIDGLALNPCQRFRKAQVQPQETKHRVAKKAETIAQLRTWRTKKDEYNMSNPRTSRNNSAKPCRSLLAVEMVGRNRRSRGSQKGILGPYDP
jgi:hypothetical protein